MLRYSGIIRRARSLAVLGQRASAVQSLQHVNINNNRLLQRYNSTVAETPTLDSVLSEKQANEKALAERKARFELSKKKFEASLSGLAKTVETQLSENTSSKQIYHSFFKSVEKLPKLQRFQYVARIILGKTINSIIHKSMAEIKDPNQTELPITPQEILNKAVYYEIADLINFNEVALYSFQSNDSKDILQLWVSYLEYSHSQRIKFAPFKLRNLTILAYLECTQGTKPEINVIKQLLKIDELPKPFDLFQLLRRNIPKSSPRFEKLNKAINSLYFSSRDPNSLDLLKKAQAAGNRGEVFRVNDILSEIRKVAELSGTGINEETLVNFMKIYNPIKFQESMKLFNEIVLSGLTPSVNAWNALLDTISRRSGSLTTRIQEVETIYHKIPNPNKESIAKLIECYTRLEQYEKVEKLATDENLASSIIAQSYLQSLAAQKKFDKLQTLTKEFESRNIPMTHFTYNRLLNAFVKENKFEDAKAILTEMSEKGIQPDVATFTIVLDLTLKSSRAKGKRVNTETINEFFGQMKINGIEPSAYTFTSVVDNLGKDASTLQSAQELFEILKSRRLVTPVTYVSLISSEFALGRTRDAETHFNEYITSGYKIIPANWAMVFEGWSLNSNIPKAREYLSILKSSDNYLPSLLNKFSYYYLLQLASKKKDIEFANEIFDLITENKASDIITPYTLRAFIGSLKQQGANVPDSIIARM